jgi:hypothetical protein
MKLYLINVSYVTPNGVTRQRNLICKDKDEIEYKLNLLSNVYMYAEKVDELLEYTGNELKFESYTDDGYTLVRYDDCTEIN